MTMAAHSASMPWVKLYVEMLDDAKMFRLAEPLKWRFVQMVLLAGECDQAGWLVSGSAPLTLEQIAWRVRVTVGVLTSELEQLKRDGLMTFDRKLDAWCVSNFEKRQGRPQSKKRELWRENKRRHRSVLKDTVRTPAGVLHTEGEGEGEEDLEGEGEAGAGAPASDAPKGNGELPETPTNGHQPADLPAAVRVYEANGGSYQTGHLVDGTSRKTHAQAFIAEHVLDTPESLQLWGQVVFQYQVQWSSKSYTVMINDYYLRGRIPGQSNGQRPGLPTSAEPKGMAAVRSYAEKRGIKVNGN